MTEPGSLDALIRGAGRRDDAEDDRLAGLRARIANEEGIAEFASMLTGGNASQLRDSAVAIRIKLGSPGSPSLESAIPAQRRAQADRNARMNH